MSAELSKIAGGNGYLWIPFAIIEEKILEKTLNNSQQ